MAVDTGRIREYYMQVKEYLDTLLVGEEKAKDVVASALLCDKNSHILLIGMPATGKSTISNNLAKNFESRKIQITSDLLPSDILGIIMSSKDGLRFLQLEELNRSSGKVQSSLVEIMAENKITCAEGEKDFSDFYVFATQNDSEIAGIFDVPQAIYDRFDVNISMGNLTDEELEKVLFDFKSKGDKASFDLNEIIDYTSQEIANFVFSKEDRRVFMDAFKKINAAEYSERRLFGSSNIRGHFFTEKMALLHAFLNGRKSIMPDDIAEYISNIYLHRINQTILRMNDERAIEEMKKLEGKVLSVERQRS